MMVSPALFCSYDLINGSQLNGDLTYQEAADLAGEIDPGMIIPGHWDMFADNSEDPEAFADYLDAKYGGRIKCIIPKVMERITIFRG